MRIHRKTTKRGKTRKHMQRLYKMKGCYKNTKRRLLAHKGGSCSTCSVSAIDGGAGWLNSQGGGGCGCGSLFSMKGGNCTTCGLTGGGTSGLVGQSWTPNPNTWGTTNHLELNTLKGGDVTRDMIATGAQPPFSVGGRRRRRMGDKTQKRQRRQTGGTFSNFLNQDLFNVGRQLTYNMGGAYNGIRGYPQPVDPRPTSGQLQGSSYKNTY